MTLKPFYLHVTPQQINGYLAAQNQKLLIIVPNYTEVFEEPPKITDETHQVFIVGVPEDELRTISENHVNKHYVWRGDPQARSKPQDKATLEILSLKPFVVVGDPETGPIGRGEAGWLAPGDAALRVFSHLPQNVQLASIIGIVSDDVLAQVPDMSPARMVPARAWAKATTDAYIASLPKG